MKSKPRIAFPKKSRRPTEAELAASLPHATGKRLDATRAFLRKQKDVTEELYYFGPKTGWAFRYLHGSQSVCTVVIRGGCPIGIVSLDKALTEAIDWKALSPVAQVARRFAHGGASLLWLDVPLHGPGAADFKVVLKAKLRALATAAVKTPAAQ